MSKYPLLWCLAVGAVLAACNLPQPAASLPLPVAETSTAEMPATPTQPEVTARPPEDPAAALPPESIMILEPGPGSRLASPLRVVGEADPTFEQSLGVRLILEDGTLLAVLPAQIQAELGQRGPFEVDVPFSVTQQQQAFLQVFADSARDGGITHLSTIGLILLPSGEATILRREPYPEQIHITSPAAGEVVQGGLMRITGIAVASFEQTLVVKLLDEDGALLVSKPITLAAEEWGIHAPFEISLDYHISAPQAGRVVVRDPSPAFPGDQHVSSVEIRLEP